MQHAFLSVISRAEFLALLRQFPALPAETLPLAQATGRVLAATLDAPEDLPPHARSCMDGYAVAAQDTFGASDANPAYLEPGPAIAIERAPDFDLAPGTASPIPTGGWLPQGADAVVMIEHTDKSGDLIEVHKAVAPSENVLEPGEDAKAGQPVLQAGHLLRAQEIGLLAGLGLAEVQVGRRPRTGILSTGDELVEIDTEPRPGQIRDVNRPALSALLAEAGADMVDLGLAPDNLDALCAALEKARADCDLILLSGGSSIGMRDLSVTGIEKLGGEILAHGVAISPGKPTILARLDGIPVMGLPGQVTSAQVVAHVLTAPLVRWLTGQPEALERSWRPMLRAELARNVAGKVGREEWLRVRLTERPGDLPLAEPILGKSGLLVTLLKADGLLPIPAESEGRYAGDLVHVMLL